MAERNKALDFFNARKQTLARNASTSSNDTTDRNSTTTTRMSTEGTLKRGNTFGSRVMGTTYERQREQDEKVSKMKSINEVEALRSVFYNFFDTQSKKGDENVNDKVLISMSPAESNINPFFDFSVENEYGRQGGLDTSTISFAYNSNNMFDRLSRVRE